MGVVGVLHAPGVALFQAVLNLHADLFIAEVGQEAELALGDAANGVCHHDENSKVCVHHIVAKQINELVHLARMDTARGHRHDLAQVGPVLVKEEPAGQVCAGHGLATDVVIALHGERITL